MNTPQALVIETPKKMRAEDVKILIEKLNPDQIGTYASLLLVVDTHLSNKYETELEVLRSMSKQIVTNFYEDFQPATTNKKN